MDEQMLTPQDLARAWGVPLATVYKHNSEGTGPRRVRIGRHVRYRRADVDAWLEQNTVQPERTEAGGRVAS